MPHAEPAAYHSIPPVQVWNPLQLVFPGYKLCREDRGEYAWLPYLIFPNNAV